MKTKPPQSGPGGGVQTEGLHRKEPIMLIDNAKAIFFGSYTSWLSWITAALVGVEVFHAELVELLPLLTPFLSDGASAKLAALTAMMIPAVRVLRQAKLAVTATVEAIRKNGGA